MRSVVRRFGTCIAGGLLLCAATIVPRAGGQSATSAPVASGPSNAALAATEQRSTPPPNERGEDLPPELQGVGIEEHLAAKLPLDAEFTDASGRRVTLRDYFDGQHPVILTLNYYKCPMLCTLQLNALISALKELDWSAGEQFKIVTASFDPLETHQLAELKRQNYLAEYGRPQAAGGWSFLTGRKKSVDALLDTTGFHVKYNEKRGEWMHATALIVCTPDGRISRYLRNIAYDPKTVRLSLVEAADGKIGTTVDHLLLFCYHYDGTEGTYTFAAWHVARIFMLLVLVTVVGFLVVLWRRDRSAAAAGKGHGIHLAQPGPSNTIS